MTEEVATECLQQEAARRYQVLIEQTPISVWEEDWPAVKLRIDELRTDGIQDIVGQLRQNWDVMLELVVLMRVTDMNSAALRVYGIKGRSRVLSGEEQVPSGNDEIRALIDWIESFTVGVDVADRMIEDLTFDGRTIVTHNSAMIP